jgi:hypothetical protein
MKRRGQTVITALSTILFVATFATAAGAECGNFAKSTLRPSVQHQSGLNFRLTTAALNLEDDSTEPIVGFWKVTFTSEGTAGIPDGAIIDQAYAQWHSDGTEIMNSSRPPITQSFCLGVWEKTDRLHYKLNHFAISWDVSNNLVGPANIREEVTVARDHNSFTGTFTIDQYDQAGNVLIHITGQLAGKRITVRSPASVAF